MRQIKTENKDGILLLSIVRPEALNALSREIVDEMETVLDELDMRTVSVLVIYSEGNFAAGADIRDMAGCDPEQARAFSFSRTFNKLTALPVPTIALIEGYALGGGLELALACDFRIAAENAKLGFPEINLGIMPGAGGTVRAPRLIGEARAKELIFTGRTVGAAEAERIGLVNSVAGSGELLEQGMLLARRLAGKAPLALAAAKKTICAGLEEKEVAQAVALEADNWAALFDTQDQKEGMRAFIEKRSPVYRGI